MTFESTLCNIKLLVFSVNCMRVFYEEWDLFCKLQEQYAMTGVSKDLHGAQVQVSAKFIGDLA